MSELGCDDIGLHVIGTFEEKGVGKMAFECLLLGGRGRVWGMNAREGGRTGGRRGVGADNGHFAGSWGLGQGLGGDDGRWVALNEVSEAGGGEWGEGEIDEGTMMSWGGDQGGGQGPRGGEDLGVSGRKAKVACMKGEGDGSLAAYVCLDDVTSCLGCL